MKHSFFAAAIAVVLLAVGCQKTEIMNQCGSSIGFESAAGKLTKAEDAAGLTTLREYGFKVWVYRNFEDEYYAGADKETYPKGLNAIYDGMEGLEVKWNVFNPNNWGTEKDYYWPGADKSLKFYAVACDETDFALNNTSVEIVNSGTATGTTTVKQFVVLEDANNDLMIASPITQAQGQGEGENKNAVKPVFSHTLTKVQFNFKTDASTIEEHPVYIQSIKTSSLKTTGSITLPTTAGTSPWTLDENATHEFVDDNDETISLPTEKKTVDGVETDVEISIDGEDTSVALDRDGLTLTATYNDLDTWLLLPQDISKATVTVTYIIKDRQFTKTFPLYAANLTKWDANQFVKYNVTIAPNLISFDPTVEDWTETNVTVGDNGVSVDPEEDEEEPTPDPTPDPDPENPEQN